MFGRRHSNLLFGISINTLNEFLQILKVDCAVVHMQQPNIVLLICDFISSWEQTVNGNVNVFRLVLILVIF